MVGVVSTLNMPQPSLTSPLKQQLLDASFIAELMNVDSLNSDFFRAGAKQWYLAKRYIKGAANTVSITQPQSHERAYITSMVIHACD